MLQRILKSIVALGVGQIIHILTQLAMPPVFIAAYGIDGFALWILLAAVTAHFSTLDFGLQTFVVNELTMLHQRGERRRFHQVQSTGMWLALGLVAIGTVLAALVFVVPVGKWIGCDDTRETHWTLFLLALQILGLILGGQLTGLYRVVANASRGVAWQNCQRGLLLVCSLALAATHAPFWQIAAAQAGSVLLVLI